ncbi:hypothetical protein H7X87_00030 [Acetobacteraceae bacterium]|nr:hypothetical protein [Candidatus Parcubacteria bacterium]
MQVGDDVHEGQALCRIRETFLHSWQEYRVVSPREGILIERSVEIKHLVKNSGYEFIADGFAVGIGEPLFILELLS